MMLKRVAAAAADMPPDPDGRMTRRAVYCRSFVGCPDHVTGDFDILYGNNTGVETPYDFTGCPSYVGGSFRLEIRKRRSQPVMVKINFKGGGVRRLCRHRRRVPRDPLRRARDG